jgi:hypothetical protein
VENQDTKKAGSVPSSRGALKTGWRKTELAIVWGEDSYGYFSQFRQAPPNSVRPKTCLGVAVLDCGECVNFRLVKRGNCSD